MRYNYIPKVVIGLVLYLIGVAVLKKVYADSVPYRYFLVCLPLLPMFYMSAMIVRFINDQDELQKRIVMEGVVFSAVATALICFSYFFLQDMGAPAFQPEWAFYLLCFLNAVGSIASSRKYL